MIDIASMLSTRSPIDHQKTFVKFIVPGSPLVESMVEIEKHFDTIIRFAENGWAPLPAHLDLDAAQ